jgi:hypothetical protein
MEAHAIRLEDGRSHLVVDSLTGKGTDPNADRGWMDANLDVQGYCLTADESRALRWGLRLPTALCLALVIIGLALQSAVLILALVPIGAIAGWTRRHPFDLTWNHGLRFGQPTAALILGGVLVAVCSLVTITNFCIPSTLLTAWWRRRGTPTPTTQPG